MLFLIVNGFPISINCATEGYLVDAVLPKPAQAEISFDDVLVVDSGTDLDEPLDQYLDIAA